MKYAEEAKGFHLTDIFIINGTMAKAGEEAQAAWKRVRAKLIICADIQAPKLHIPPELIDEDGYVISGKVANAQKPKKSKKRN